MINENQWNSRIAFLLSMIGAAVGLGNIWRYIVYYLKFINFNRQIINHVN